MNYERRHHFTLCPMKHPLWHLPFDPPPHPRPMQLGESLLSMGSCFAERLGERFHRLFLPATVNPFGIGFDVLTLGRQLRYLAGKSIESSPFEHLGLWRHFDVHGSLSLGDRNAFEQQLEVRLSQGRKAYQNSRWMMLTLGTAHFFIHHATHQPVANCHKLPGQAFERKLATVEEMVEALQGPIQHFLDQDTGREVLLSVSPVRHVRDGLVANNRSKGRLLEVCHQLTEKWNRVHYVPAYEWWMDVWRDHRFYAEDMVHPSPQSVQWMMEQFFARTADQRMQAAIEALEAIAQFTQHRPLHPSPKQEEERARQLAEMKKTFEEKFQYPISQALAT